MKRFLPLFIWPFPLTLAAQFSETIYTDRPGQAIGAFTVGSGIFQIQSGFDYLGSKGNETIVTGFLNNTVLRYGLTEPFEINAQLEYKTETVTENSSKATHGGLSAMDVGIRYNILAGKALIPNLGFQFRLRLPVFNGDYEINNIAPQFIFVTNQQLSNTFMLSTNWGGKWDGNTRSPIGTYVINLAFPIAGKVGSFIETFGEYGNQQFFFNFDTGISWLLTPDLQLDLYGGYGKNYGIANYFISTGVSWRTKQKP